MCRMTVAARAALPAAALLLAALLGACGPGSGEGLDANGDPLPPPGTDGAAGLCPAGTLAPTWGCVQALVFDPECTHCHSGPFTSAGLRLDEANSPDAIGSASGEQPALDLIAPGDPDASYLVRKVEGAATISGGRMPLDGPPYLTDAQLQAIRDWIAAGAAVP